MKKIVKENLSETYNYKTLEDVKSEYNKFLGYIHNINYEDLIEYAELAGHSKTLDVLDYLKRKSKYI